MKFSLAAAAFVSFAFGQTAADSRLFEFKTAETVQQMQEMATVIRSIGDIREVSVDAEGKRFSMRGSAGQIALAEWLFNELDKPASTQPPADTAAREYRIDDSPESVVRVFYLPGGLTIQQFQEMATLTRTITEARRAFTYNTARALVLRGTPEQIATAEWLLKQLSHDQTGSPEFRVPETSDEFVRVFYLPNTRTVQDFQEVATLVRSIGEIRRLLTYNTTRAIALRGTAEQVALAGWLTQELDGPSAPHTASPQYQIAGKNDGVVKVFYLRNSDSVQSFQQAAQFIRSTTQIRRAFTYNGPRALALRGTATEIGEAELLINARKYGMLPFPAGVNRKLIPA